MAESIADLAQKYKNSNKESSKSVNNETKRSSIDLPIELNRRLRHYTFDHNIKMKDFIIEAIEEKLKRVKE